MPDALMLSFRGASFIVLVVALLFRALSGPAELNTDALYDTDGAGDARVLLVTAHPDDEAMFFAPTLLALAAKVRASVRYYRNIGLTLLQGRVCILSLPFRGEC